MAATGGSYQKRERHEDADKNDDRARDERGARRHLRRRHHARRRVQVGHANARAGRPPFAQVKAAAAGTKTETAPFGERGGGRSSRAAVH